MRRAAEVARQAELRAIEAQFKARHAAEKADEAAAHARAGAPGTKAETIGEFQYETDHSNGQRNGFGVRTGLDDIFKGNTYRGQWKDGDRSGHGIYAFAENPGNTANSLTYEGEWANDKYNGHGVYTWRSGNVYMLAAKRMMSNQAPAC